MVSRVELTAGMNELNSGKKAVTDMLPEGLWGQVLAGRSCVKEEGPLKQCCALGETRSLGGENSCFRSADRACGTSVKELNLAKHQMRFELAVGECESGEVEE
jgi:hypothetical protein